MVDLTTQATAATLSNSLQGGVSVYQPNLGGPGNRGLILSFPPKIEGNLQFQ